MALLSRLPLGALVTPLAKPNAGEVLNFYKSEAEDEMFPNDGRVCDIFCVTLEPSASVHGARVREGMQLVWSLHVCGHGLAGLWSEVSLSLL